MTVAKILKCKSGFSLIELMIVVAIIAILATVATPNFMRYQGVARASEARAQLSALFASQRAFQAEWAGYYSDLVNIGYRANGTLRYVVGHGAASTHILPGYSGSALLAANYNTAVAGVCAQIGCLHGAEDGAGTSLTSAVISNTMTANFATFTAQAAGFVGGSTTDVWQIDQHRAVLNTTPGGF